MSDAHTSCPTRFDAQLLRQLREGRLTGEKWLLGGSTAALRWCALLSSSLTVIPPGPPDTFPGDEDDYPTGKAASRADEDDFSGVEQGREGRGRDGALNLTENLTEALKQHFMDMVYRKGDSPTTLAPMM